MEKVKKIPVFDLNFAAFQHLQGNTPELNLKGTRVLFLFKPNNLFYQLSERYSNNESVNVLDFVNATRQLRSMMMSLKGQR